MDKKNNYKGMKFGKDGHLEVIGWSGATQPKGAKLYDVKCSICEKDSELFGDGLFKSSINNLYSGSIPCGCAKQVKWTSEQQIIRIKRICKERNLTFLGFSGEFKGGDTKISLLCLKDAHIWNSGTIENFISGNGCPECRRAKAVKISTKPDSVMIESFMQSGKYSEGFKFWRGDHKRGRSGTWHYTCPTCSNDEYVKAGVCNGIFNSKYTMLQSGNYSCRCSTQFRWTAEQREYQIKKIFAGGESRAHFVRWKDTYNGCSSEAVMSCHEHGEWNATVNNLINHSSKCPSCAKFGFDPTKPASLYVLNVAGVCGGFTGYGISNVINKRLTSHRLELSRSGLSIIEEKIFIMQGTSAARIEKSIKDYFERNPQNIEGFKTESTHQRLFNNVVQFVEKLINEEEHTTQPFGILETTQAA